MAERYKNLIGDGECNAPPIVVSWNDHVFGHVPMEPDPIAAQAIAVGGMWPYIDAMLTKLYGSMSEDERLEWYEDHKDDLVGIATPNNAQHKSVYRWSDKLRFRHVAERFRDVVAPEIAQKYKEIVGPQEPPSHRH